MTKSNNDDTVEVTLTVIHGTSSFSCVFGCGAYYTDEAAAERHEKSGCKGCRRFLRRRDAIDRKNGVVFGEPFRYLPYKESE